MGEKQKIITRFPPSPTGALHIGNVRTAIFNYLFAKKHGGEFIVRIEDTDKARSEKKHEENMLASLIWLGLKRDRSEELWRQTERTEIYTAYLRKMIAEDKAYISQETEGLNKEVVRFRNPNKIVTFEDLIRGIVSFDTTELGDFIIARNINDPIYHLAVVVDDFESGVTHVIRGEDHISNTPRQILIQEAIGAPRPIYAHLPLILAADRSKLSKRKHGEAVSLDYYKNKGYLPQAIVNYLSLIGWNPGTEQEIFTIDELIHAFDFNQVQKGSAIFDEKKLEWVNKEHIKLLPPAEQLKFIAKDFDITAEPVLDISKIAWKQSTPLEAKKHLLKAAEVVEADEDLMAYATEAGKGNVLWPVRYALSGLEKSPDPLTLITILGKEKSVERIRKAAELL